MSFKEKLKGLMAEMGLSQVQTARLIGVAPSSLSQYLSGMNEPPKAKKCKIALALGVQENYFDEILPIAKIDTGVKLTPDDVAILLKCGVDTIREGLIDGRFPWGYAVKKRGSEHWTYIICPIRFMQETGIQVQTTEEIKV